MTTAVDLPTADREAHRRALLHLIGECEAHRLTVPCRQPGVAYLWTSEDPADQRLAAAGCGECPARRACLDYITAWPKEHGTYGGKPDHQRHRLRRS